MIMHLLKFWRGSMKLTSWPSLLFPLLLCSTLIGCSSNNGPTGPDREPVISDETPEADGADLGEEIGPSDGLDGSDEVSGPPPNDIHYESLEGVEFEWHVLAQTGVWRWRVGYPNYIELDENSIVQGWAESTSVYIYESGSDDQVLVRTCEDRSQEAFTIKELASVSLEAEGCELPGSGSVRFLSNKHIQYETYCGDERAESVDIKKLSDEPEFNLGHISFGSSQYPDLVTDTGVCGRISRAKVAVQSSDGLDAPSSSADSSKEVEISIIQISVPYQGGYLLMDIRGVHSPGEYSLTDGNTSDIEVVLWSDEFGNTEDGPASININSGRLNVVEIDDFSFQLAFDLVSSTGDRMHGSVSLDLD